jgi:hypothetical protein
MAQDMTRDLEQYVRASGGKPVYTWTGPGRAGRMRALLVCTNEDGTGLVVAVLNDSGEGAVVTVLGDEAVNLAFSLAAWQQSL